MWGELLTLRENSTKEDVSAAKFICIRLEGTLELDLRLLIQREVDKCMADSQYRCC